MSNTQDYVQWFRGTAPYIKAHRKKAFVIMVSDEIIYSDRFIGLVHDIALLNHLGIKLVILHGSRSSIDSHLADNKLDYRPACRIPRCLVQSFPWSAVIS
jgi:amino-acid N-acetyltransferase